MAIFIIFWPHVHDYYSKTCFLAPDSSPHNCTRKNSENTMYVNYWITLVQKSWDCKLELYQWSVLDWKGRCDCGCDIDTVTLSWKSLDGERWEAGMVALLSMHLIKGPSASAGTCNCWISFHPLHWSWFTWVPDLSWDRTRLGINELIIRIDSLFIDNLGNIYISGGKMYGLIFENFSGYIKVGGEEHKYI